MSVRYINQMRRVREEFFAASAALRFMVQYAQHEYVQNRIEDGDDRGGAIPVAHFSRAANSIERTYFIRLFSEFESILKSHLSTNHPLSWQVLENRKPKVDQLLARVVRYDNLQIDQTLRDRFNNIRDYRNSIAHQSPLQNARIITFADALARLNKILEKLPEPRE
jgi:hypothetical protein